MDNQKIYAKKLIMLNKKLIILFIILNSLYQSNAQTFKYDTVVNLDNNLLYIQYPCCLRPGVIHFYPNFLDTFLSVQNINIITLSNKENIYWGYFVLIDDRDEHSIKMGSLIIIYKNKIFIYKLYKKNNNIIFTDQSGDNFCPILNIKSFLFNKNKIVKSTEKEKNILSNFYQKHLINNSNIEDIVIKINYTCDYKIFSKPLIITFKNEIPFVNGKTSENVNW